MGSHGVYDEVGTYDYVVCGYVGAGILVCWASKELTESDSGGTAGCVLAARLAEDQNASVLLVEAGKLNTDVPASSIPGG